MHERSYAPWYFNFLLPGCIAIRIATHLLYPHHSWLMSCKRTLWVVVHKSTKILNLTYSVSNKLPSQLLTLALSSGIISNVCHKSIMFFVEWYIVALRGVGEHGASPRWRQYPPCWSLNQGCKFSCFYRNSCFHEVQIPILLFLFSPFWRLFAQIHTLFQAFQAFSFWSAYIPAQCSSAATENDRLNAISLHEP